MTILVATAKRHERLMPVIGQRVQMLIRSMPSEAALLSRKRLIASDGWEPALTNERADRRRSCHTKQSVDSWNESRGDSGLVAMELGCD